MKRRGGLRSSWRARARPSLGVPASLSFSLREMLLGLITGTVSFAASILISEFGVWVFTLWMMPEGDIVNYFYITFSFLNLIIMIVPIKKKRYFRFLVALILVIALTYLAVNYFNFHPIHTIFGELNY